MVGPNGCGKSNIIDAVRWVLGESKASRAARRVDAGRDLQRHHHPQAGRPRRRSNWCSTTPTARAGRPVGQYAEIAVKRVLTRDGTSSYYINNQPVRRRDIQDIFLGTGLGPRAYAIIGQGMISASSNRKPGRAAPVPRRSGRRLEVQGAPPRDREPAARHAREPDARRRHPARAERQPGKAGSAGRGRAEIPRAAGRPGRKAEAAVAAAQERGEGRAGAAASARSEQAQTDLEEQTAKLRHVEAELEHMRQAHYAAGDRMHQAQGAAVPDQFRNRQPGSADQVRRSNRATGCRASSTR